MVAGEHTFKVVNSFLLWTIGGVIECDSKFFNVYLSGKECKQNKHGEKDESVYAKKYDVRTSAV